MLNIFNTLLSSWTLSAAWKEAIIIGIHKTEKPRNLPSNYRPICLLNSLGKIYKSVILKRLFSQPDLKWAVRF